MPTTRAIPTEVHYMEPVRPRNCRKDRVRENVFLANAEFDCFTEEEAPVALIVKHYGSRYDEETDEMFYECNETPYRLANGKLYTCYEILEDTDRLSLEPYSHKPNYDLETLHQDPWNPRVVKRSCTGAGASLIGNAPDCSHCLNCRCLFSAYAPLPVPEALLPITLLAPGCPYDLPWLRNARTEPDAAGKAQKTFASQNSSPYGFLVPPCPWSEPVRLPDHKEGHKGPHQVPRRSS